MTNNPQFTNPAPSLAEVSAAISEASGAYSLARGRGKLHTEIMYQKVKRMDDLVTKLALYVRVMAEDDKAIA